MDEHTHTHSFRSLHSPMQMCFQCGLRVKVQSVEQLGKQMKGISDDYPRDTIVLKT